MKKHLLLLFAALLPLVASAQTKVEIDGIWYNLTAETREAEVTFKGDYPYSYENEYSGFITLPATVTYGGVTYSVTSIGQQAFAYCSSLTAITIPEGVTSIGSEAFFCCSSLTDITLPEGVTSIEWSAFSRCESLTAITIPEGVTSIGDDAFACCSSLTTITIPEGVTSIGDYAFGRCSSLTAITLPEGMTSIGKEALKNTGITYLTILGKPTIDEKAFDGCEKLTDIYCYSEEVPPAENAFGGLDLSRIILHVPKRALKRYKNTEPWSRFGAIEVIK